MASCREMKKGEVYACEDCGIELTVTRTCGDQAHEGASCRAGADCEIACCGKPLALKSKTKARIATKG